LGKRSKGELAILKAIADGRIHASSRDHWRKAWGKNAKATAAVLAEFEPVPALIDEAINDGRLAVVARDAWFAHWKESPKATETMIKNTPKGTRLAPGPTKAEFDALSSLGSGSSDGLPASWFRAPRSHTGAARTEAGMANGATVASGMPSPPDAPPPASPPAASVKAAQPLDFPELKRPTASRRGRVMMDQTYGSDG
jgi:hypothetical protein